MSGAAERLADLVIARARTIRFLSLVLLVLAALSLLRLEVDAGLVSMLPSGRPAFDAYREFVERFAEEDVALAVVRARDQQEAVLFGEAFADALVAEDAVASARSTSFHAMASACSLSCSRLRQAMNYRRSRNWRGPSRGPSRRLAR